jgi:hypothetical protein
VHQYHSPVTTSANQITLPGYRLCAQLNGYPTNILLTCAHMPEKCYTVITFCGAHWFLALLTIALHISSYCSTAREWLQHLMLTSTSLPPWSADTRSATCVTLTGNFRTRYQCKCRLGTKNERMAPTLEGPAQSFDPTNLKRSEIPMGKKNELRKMREFV